MSLRTTVLTLSAYFFTGISLTLYNKWLVSTRDFRYPVTMIMVHMISNFLLSAITLKTFLIDTIRTSVFAPQNMKFGMFLKRFVPVGMLFAADIALTNLSFVYVAVSLTEVVKSGIPAGLMIYAAVRGDQFMLKSKMVVILCLCAGIALTSYGDVAFDERGFAAAVGALITGVIRLILLEKILDETDQSINQSTTEKETQKRRLVLTQSPKSQNLRSKITGKLKNIGKKSFSQSSKPPANKSKYALVSGADESENEDDLFDVTIEGFEEAEDNDTETSSMVQTHSPASINHMKHANEHSASQSSISNMNRSESSTHLVVNDNTSINQSSQHPTHQSLNDSTDHSVHLESFDVPHVHQSSSHKSRLHPVLSMFYFSPVAALVLTPSFFAFEFQPLVHFDSFRNSNTSSVDHWPTTDFLADSNIIWHTSGLLTAGAFLAFGLNISELMTIQHTSALTLCVLSSIKFLMVLALSTWFFEKQLTITNLIGCGVSVLGIASYNYIKWCEITSQEATNIEHATEDPANHKSINQSDQLPELELTELVDEYEETSLFDRDDEKVEELTDEPINQSENDSGDEANVVIEYQYRATHPPSIQTINQSINRSDQPIDDPELSPISDTHFAEHPAREDSSKSINQSINESRRQSESESSSGLQSTNQSTNQSRRQSVSDSATSRHPVLLLSQPPLDTP